ncbi:MAG: RlmE family RNA methyltransferase [Alphaproteobacteria bacterium]
MAQRKGGGGSGRRTKAVRVHRAKGRKASSTRWLHRHLNDPYVQEARATGYRSRAAFKLLQLDKRFHFLRRDARVLDLGAAPGGWSQVAAEKVGPGGWVVAIDILPMDPIPGVEVVTADIESEAGLAACRDLLGGPADVVLSDMAPATTGHAPTDHLRIVRLCEAGLAAAEELLAPGGTFVAKVFQGGAQGELLDRLKERFAVVRHAKPPASRQESPETYVVAQDFRPVGPAR